MTTSGSSVPVPTPFGSSPMQRYLDRATAVLEKFGVLPKSPVPNELTKLLDEVKHVDEPKALAIARTVKFMGTFNQLVRDNVEDIDIGNRYLAITQMFDSIREDSKALIAQLDDGKITFGERMSNLWMKMRRGTPSDRFARISEIYREVAGDTKKQL